MNTWQILVLLLAFGLLNSYADEKKKELPVSRVLNKGEVLKVQIDNNKIKRIVISLQNLLEEESVVIRSQFFNGKEKPENEIGPEIVRTTKLQAKIEDESAPVKKDRKTIVLDMTNTDEIQIKVVEGKVSVAISEEKKKM